MTIRQPFTIRSVGAVVFIAVVLYDAVVACVLVAVFAGQEAFCITDKLWLEHNDQETFCAPSYFSWFFVL